MCDAHGDTVREHAYELLEACKETADWMKYRAGYDNVAWALLDKMLAAIAKAEGRTP